MGRMENAAGLGHAAAGRFGAAGQSNVVQPATALDANIENAALLDERLGTLLGRLMSLRVRVVGLPGAGGGAKGGDTAADAGCPVAKLDMLRSTVDGCHATVNELEGVLGVLEESL